MFKIELPVWLHGEKVKQLASFIENWWEQVRLWLSLPLSQIDPDTCSIGMLDLMAWGRSVKRFTDEPEYLYRLRVKHAVVNAQDAGSVIGIQRIFERLGIGYVEVLERQPDIDWDIIQLQLSDSQLSQNQELLRLILEKYGRTCRRYEFSIVSPVGLGISGHEFNHEWYYDDAS